jgi:YVTN family beta-propeller protein
MGYANYVGRVGALAVALGVGAAVATGTPGVAWAGPDSTNGSPSADNDNKVKTSGADSSSSNTPKPGDTLKKTIDRAADDLRHVVSSVVTSSGGVIKSQLRHAADAVKDSTTAPPSPSRTKLPSRQFVSDFTHDDQTPQSTGIDVVEPQSSRGAQTIDSAPKWKNPLKDVAEVVAPRPTIKVLDKFNDATADAINPLTGGRTFVQPKVAERNTISTLDAPTDGVVPAITRAPLGLITNVLATALAPFFGANSPGQPQPQNPVLWAVLGWVRRQFDQTPLGKIVDNRPPVVAAEPEVDPVDDSDNLVVNVHATDPDGDAVHTVSATNGTHGTTTVNADGTVTYNPSDDYDGPDTFTVTVSDEGSGVHLHGLAGLFSPNGGHTTTTEVSVQVQHEAAGPNPETGEVKNVAIGQSDNLNIGDFDGKPIITDLGTITLHVDGQTVTGDFLPSDSARYQASTVNQFAAFRSFSAANLQAAEAPQPVMESTDVQVGNETFTVTVPVLPAHYEAGTPITTGSGPFYTVTSGDRLYVYDSSNLSATNPGPVTVSVIDTTTNQLVDADPSTPAVDPIVLGSQPVSAQPSGMVATGNRVYIANHDLATGTGSVTVIDTEHNTVLAPIAVTGSPSSIAVSGDKLYVSKADGSIAVINVKSGDPSYGQAIPAEAITTGAVNAHIVVHGDTLYVTDQGTSTPSNPGGTVHVINLNADSPDFAYGEDIAPAVSVDNGFPGPPVVSAPYDSDGDAYVYVPNVQVPIGPPQPGKVTVIDTKTNTVVGTIEVPSGPSNVVFSPDGSLAYIANADSVSVVDTATRTVLFTTPADVSPDGSSNYVAVSRDGKSVYVSDLFTTYDPQHGVIDLGNTVSVLSLTTGTGSTPDIL